MEWNYSKKKSQQIQQRPPKNLSFPHERMKTNPSMNHHHRRRRSSSSNSHHHHQSNNSIVKKASFSKFPEQSKKYGLLRFKQHQQQQSKLIIKTNKTKQKILSSSSIKIHQAPPRSNKRERFQLRLPAVSDSSSVLFRNTEWFQTFNETTPTSLSFPTNLKKTIKHKSLPCKKGIITDTFSSQSLQQLSRELEAFAAYVRLRPMEHDARQFFIQTMSELAFSTFGPEKQKHQQQQQQDNTNSDHETTNSIHLQVFGSYATPLICPYCSDVDMALWGVVDAPNINTSFLQNLDEQNNNHDKDDNANEQETTTNPTNNSVIFVLDREGEELEQEITPQVQSPTKPSTQVANHLTVSSDSEADSADKLETLNRKQAFLLTKAGSNNMKQNSHVYVPDENDDDDDTDFSLLELQQPPTKRRKLSNTSHDNNSNHGNNMHSHDEQNTTNLEVSIQNIPFYNNTLMAPSAIGPVGKTRTLVLRALQSLKQGMHRHRIFSNIEIRRHARVPIVNMESRLGFEGDIAIGGHNGTDTSHFAKALVERYQSFAPVILLLKILMRQQDLDKPFTGGLGSYKLYVLLCHHLEIHLSLGGNDEPGEVLASFFYRYSRNTLKPLNVSPKCHTPLGSQSEIPCHGGIADLKPCYNLDHCTQLFSICWQRLSKRLLASSFDEDNPSTCSSFLVDFIRQQSLKVQREEILQRASHWGKYKTEVDQFSQTTPARISTFFQRTASQSRSSSMIQVPSSSRQGTKNTGITITHKKHVIVHHGTTESKTLNTKRAPTNGKKREKQEDTTRKNHHTTRVTPKNLPQDRDAGEEELLRGYRVCRNEKGVLVPLHRPDREESLGKTAFAKLLGKISKRRKNKKKQSRDEGLQAIAQTFVFEP